MPKITYVEKRFGAAARAMIDQANLIITEYQAQGFDLTLRQLYYQFVARDLIPNKQASYAKLGGVINDARLAGLIDWRAIVDRTRDLRKNPHWENPAAIVGACATQYQINKWENQSTHVEVWIEKDALVGVIDQVCRRLDIGFFSCRGYTSQSEMWEAGQRLRDVASDDKDVVILHLGDHDPSGIDMSRDIEDRIRLFMGRYSDRFEMDRIALNQDQIDRYNPPPNPAKITDPRATGYLKIHGQQSWELDALEPRVLSSLIEKRVLSYRDEDLWQEMVERETKDKKALELAAKRLARKGKDSGKN